MAKETINNKQKKAVIQIALIALVLILVNVGLSFFNHKVDLTKDQRYTITPATKKLLKDLPARVNVFVFLHGEHFPAAFRRLSRSTEDMLKNFREISGNKVNYIFIDPLGDDTMALKMLNFYQMSGVPITFSAGKKGTEQRMLFPWALITHQDDLELTHGFPVFLQESNTAELSRSILLRSEMLLEYNLANAIHLITKDHIPGVAYLTGNGQPFGFDVYAAFEELSTYYRLDTFNLENDGLLPSDLEAVVINNPSRPFSETAKFKLDQYLMNGGHIYLNIDGATGTLDSFDQSGSFNAMALDLNLDDLLYQYGVRLNHNLLLDAVNSAGIPLTPKGNNPQPTIFPWVYFPVLQAGSEHPIVKNLNGVLGRFVSTIDTNANDPSIKKTILLSSSDYSRTEPTPTPVLLESAMIEINPATYLQKRLTAAVLLEGQFSSLYAQRMPEEVKDYVYNHHLKMIPKAEKTGKIIIAADGEIISNEFSEKNGPSDMGVYRFSDYRFDNKAFLLNSMEYLTDPNNLLEARAKKFEQQVLDPKRVQKERQKWQFINIGVPVLSILIFGAAFFFIRQKKYT